MKPHSALRRESIGTDHVFYQDIYRFHSIWQLVDGIHISLSSSEKCVRARRCILRGCTVDLVIVSIITAVCIELHVSDVVLLIFQGAHSSVFQINGQLIIAHCQAVGIGFPDAASANSSFRYVARCPGRYLFCCI